MNKHNEKLLTIEDVAEFLQVKPSVVKYWIYNRDIPFIKLGRYIRFDHNEIKCWIEENKSNNGNLKRRNFLRLIT